MPDKQSLDKAQAKLLPQDYLQLRIHPVLILIFFCATAFFAKISGKGLMSYDDLYYAEKAREILTTKDWFTIHYNGMPSFDTAPMYYWLAAISYLIFGVTEYGAVLPSALLGTLSVVLLFFWVRKESGPRIAFVSAIVLATIPHFVKFSRHSMLDVTLTFFTIVSLYSFFEAQKPGGRKWLYLLWGLGAAGGILTKSILGTFPIWIAGAYLLTGRRWRELINPFMWLGVAVALLLGVGWYVAQYLYHGQIVIKEHIGGLLIERAFQPEQQGDIWYRLKYVLMPLMYMPHWALFMYLGFGRMFGEARRGSDWARLLFIWVAVITLVLSMCANTKTWYYMSALPGLAIMAGLTIDAWIQKLSRDPAAFYRRLTFATAVLAILFNMVATTTPISLGRQRETDVREFSPYITKLGRAGYRMVGYKADRIAMNNATLFYAEYSFDPIIRDAKEFLKAFSASTPVAAMVRKEYWAEVRDLELPENAGTAAASTSSDAEGDGVAPVLEGVPKTGHARRLHIVKQGDDYFLVTNRPMDFSDVLHLKSRWLQ
jgi:4-amino-4-deoxy-L-arabinose transferase-like glycosyltransferase